MENQMKVTFDLYVRRVQETAQKAYEFLEESLRPIVQVESGRKYHKVIIAHDGGTGQRMVHSFVDRKTGDLYKPAGWAAPAKGVRYNVVKDAARLQKVVDPYGSYLYKNYTATPVQL